MCTIPTAAHCIDPVFVLQAVPVTALSTEIALPAVAGKRYACSDV
jgi:hypothetical protein